MKLTIVNRSAWPDWFVRPLASWVAGRAGITWDFRLTLKAAVRPDYWRGRSYGRRECNLTYHRRGTGTKVKDHRFGWGPAYSIRPGVEMLVYLMAHEMYHSTGGDPDKFRLPNGLTNRDLMEFRCNEFGATAVVALREEWPAFRSRLLASERRRRQRCRSVADRAEARQVQAKAPDTRLVHKQALLARWETKAKRAETACRKLRRSIAAIERANKKGRPHAD